MRISRIVPRQLRRFIYGFRYFSPQLFQLVRWSVRRTESHNYYYSINDLNREYAIEFVSTVTKVGRNQIKAYFDELDNNWELARKIKRHWEKDPDMRDSIVAYGRRVAWYAFARSTKPKCILETGVHQGLGTLILCEALKANAAEGHPGEYFGTDIDPKAGSLVDSSYQDFAKILYGDSIESINALEKVIDLFVSDSDHSFDYEYNEYIAVAAKLSKNSVIIGDNSHISNRLLMFSRENNRSFLFFKEAPANHWYPGGGMGISY